MRKLLVGSAFGLLLSVGSVWAAEVVIRVAPPAPVVERRIATPGPGYVWTGGYHRWDGRAYVWVPGAWVRPPHPHAHWVAPHYAHRHGGYVFVAGHWR